MTKSAGAASACSGPPVGRIRRRRELRSKSRPGRSGSRPAWPGSRAASPGSCSGCPRSGAARYEGAWARSTGTATSWRCLARTTRIAPGTLLPRFALVRKWRGAARQPPGVVPMIGRASSQPSGSFVGTTRGHSGPDTGPQSGPAPRPECSPGDGCRRAVCREQIPRCTHRGPLVALLRSHAIRADQARGAVLLISRPCPNGPLR